MIDVTESQITVYEALMGYLPAFVKGPDFFALNYGPTYPGGGWRSVKISGDKVSYESNTSKKEFPKNINFQVRDPLMPIVNADHIGDYGTLSLRTSLSLDKLVKVLERRGVKFEKK